MKKIIVTILILAVVFSPALAVPARAQWIDWANLVPNTATGVSSWSMMIKEFALDAVAYQVVNMMIERMTNSTVKWINSGFQGGPAYVTDPAAYYLETADRIAGQYILEDPNLNFLCGPISAKIRVALQKSYAREQQWQCTLTEVGRNLEDFMNDFDNGGWDNFFELTQRPQNNPIGAYLQAEADLNSRLAQALDIKKDDLRWGQGFMSYQKCVQYHPKYDSCVNEEGVSPEQCEKWYCESYETLTPGSVISDRLNTALGVSESRLSVADEINEIVSAFLSQLTSKALQGLKGLGSGSSDDGSEKKIEEFINESNKSVDEYLNTDTPDFERCLNNPDDPVCTGSGSSGSSGSSATRPTDLDCQGIDGNELLRMAIESDLYQIYGDIEQAVRELDCEPPGIH